MTQLWVWKPLPKFLQSMCSTSDLYLIGQQSLATDWLGSFFETSWWNTCCDVQVYDCDSDKDCIYVVYVISWSDRELELGRRVYTCLGCQHKNFHHFGVWTQFAQVDTQFQVHGIMAQRTKFDHMVASLSPEVATEVRDIILTPPDMQPHGKLRQQLARRTAQSERRRIQQLLNSQDFENLTLTCLVQKLKQLKDETWDAEDPIFCKFELWVLWVSPEFADEYPCSFGVIGKHSVIGRIIAAERMTEAGLSFASVINVVSLGNTRSEVNQLRTDVADLKKPAELCCNIS